MDGTFWQFVKDLISSRGAQMLARYLSYPVTALATWAGIHIAANDETQWLTLTATIVAGVLCHAIDLWSHSISSAKTVNEAISIGVAIGEEQKSTKSFSVHLPIAVAFLVLLGGCTSVDKIEAGIAAAVATVATHTEVSVSYDPITGAATATLNIKDPNNRIIETRVLTAREMKDACTAECSHADKALRASYKQALKEMEATEKRERQAIKDRRKQCGTTTYTVPPTAVYVAPSTPQVGDVFTPDIPPPSGIMKGGMCDPKTGVCK